MRSIVLSRSRVVGASFIMMIGTAACRTTTGTDGEGSTTASAGAVQQTAAPGPCLFGETVDDLEVSPEFRSVARGEQRRVPRVGDGVTRVYSHVELRRTGTGDRYALYKAEDDDAAAGSGWIEDSSGALVGEIRDGQIVECAVAEPMQNKVTEESCLFGVDLAGLLGLGEFNVKPEADGRRTSPLAADGRASKNVRVRSLTHTKSGSSFKLYALKDEPQFTSDATGWIENTGGIVVAQFGVGEIYRCDVDANGTVRPAAPEAEDAEPTETEP